MDCQFISIYRKFVTSLSAYYSCEDINHNAALVDHKETFLRGQGGGGGSNETCLKHTWLFTQHLYLHFARAVPNNQYMANNCQ